MISDEGPDKGYAWVIAIAACIINMILSGLSRMIGMLYVAVLNEYGVSRQEATTPFSVRNSIRCLAGPLVGLVGQKYGIRAVTFFGGIVAALGASLCSIAPNVIWLSVFWGGIHGLGFAFANTLFQVVVNQYFRKHRATASGIALSGACLGSIAFPFMIEAILDTYNLSGAFLILGGVVMHVLPPSLLLCSPPWLNKRKKEGDSREKPQPNVPSPPVANEESQTYRVYRTTSLSNCPVDSIELQKAMNLTSTGSGPTDTENVTNREPCCRPPSSCLSNLAYVKEELCSEKSQYEETTIDMNCPKIFSVQNAMTENGFPNSDTKDHKPVDDNVSKPLKRTSGLVVGILSIVNLYKNPVYVLISFGMATYVIVFIPILTVIVDYSKDKGMGESEGKFLINAMAVGDLIGRLGFGWVTDRGIMTIPKFFTTTMVLQALFISLFPFAMNLVTFMTLLCLYGMVAGSMLILFPVLVLKYVPSDQQPVGMGCVGFMSGLVTFGMPPLIGHFRDKVGSYDGMFFLIGGISFVSGALWFLEPIMMKLQLKRQEAAANS